MKPVVHIIEEVIARMLDRYPDLKYHYGTRQEIITTFTEMTESITIKSSMFPAICLIMPFKETVKGSGNRDINLNLLILTDSIPRVAGRYPGFKISAQLYASSASSRRPSSERQFPRLEKYEESRLLKSMAFKKYCTATL